MAGGVAVAVCFAAVLAATLFGVLVAVVGAVAWSRMYQGMQFLSDVIAAIVLGLVSLGICLLVIGSPAETSARASDR